VSNNTKFRSSASCEKFRPSFAIGWEDEGVDWGVGALEEKVIGERGRGERGKGMLRKKRKWMIRYLGMCLDKKGRCQALRM